MHLSRLTSVGAVTAAALALSTALAAPASAAAGAGTGSVLGPNGRSLTVTVGLQRGNTSAFACAAVSTGDVVATSIDSCTLVVNGVQVARSALALPGPTAVTGGVHLGLPPGADVLVCATGRGTYLDSSMLQVSHCASPVASVPAPYVYKPPPLPSDPTAIGIGYVGCFLETMLGNPRCTTNWG